MGDRELRRCILISFGASDRVADELLDYTANSFDYARDAPGVVPDDEAFVDAWRSYAVESEEIGGFECLRHRLVQLRFPIRRGISNTDAYLAATRRGEIPLKGDGLTLSSPDALRVVIHPTAAGHIPLLITEQRADFVALVRALTRRNEPVSIPDSMGACMVSGYNNWDRVFTYRREWEWNHPNASWEQEFKSFLHRKELYQDRFIVLSHGPYSGVSALSMGLPPDVWLAASHMIRLEHECTHYYTRRMLGSMRNNLFDELIADYMGIVSVAGRFRADWFLQFMGLENFPSRRSSGRFDNYAAGLSTKASNVLCRVVVEAARGLETTSEGATNVNYSDQLQKATVIKALAMRSLEELAVGEITLR